MLFIKSYKAPHAAFDIINYVSLATGNTQLSIHHKLNQPDLQTIPPKTFTLTDSQGYGTTFQLSIRSSTSPQSNTNYAKAYGTTS